LSEETKVYYTEVGIQRVRIRKTMAGAIILEVLGDKERNKATALTARLTQAFDPATVRVTAPARTAELRVTGVDISVGKVELRDTLAGGGGCGTFEVQVGDTRTSRGNLESAWIRFSTAAARKLTRREGLPWTSQLKEWKPSRRGPCSVSNAWSWNT
jgi:hypothetical protein